MMINICFLILCLCLMITHISHNVNGIQDTLKRDLELKTKSKFIKKSPIKTIHTEFGDIIDCIDIYEQSAFNHPLLKNHTLQRKPNFENLIEKTSVNSQIESMFGLDKEKCPIGTVPVQRRTKYEGDLIEENILFNDDILVKDNPGLHLAEVYVRSEVGPFYKVSGINSVYNPHGVTKNQISLSHIWVENGPTQSANKIAIGWHVDPQLNGDTRTRLFATWTSDNYKKTGCTNVRCRGFVQVDRSKYLGGYLSNISVYGGLTYEVRTAITQDPVTKNWWLTLGNINIGYYPAALFSNLGSARIVGWGGRTKANVGSPSPPMGSGHVPDGNVTHACYFRSVLVQDSSRDIYGPKPSQTASFSDNTNCYDVKYYGYQEEGSVLQFGGPGGNCGN